MNKLPPFFIIIASVIAALFCSSCNKNLPADYLREGFMNPPDSARPGVYWYFMDGNIDRDAITADLESMKKAGLGYVVFLEVNVGVPRGKVDFLSEEWQDLFTHAVREAERLGIRIILGSGPGWAGSGGPWVNPSESMLHLVASDTTLTGPSHFEGRLTVPAPMTPFFGEGSLTAELKQIRDEWYKDVSILSFPAPEVQEIIDNIDEKALYYRAPFTSQKGVLPYLPEPIGLKRSDEWAVSPEKIINLTDRMQNGGILKWDVPPGKWTIMRFVERNNGAVTRPAPVPGLGFECDKLDRTAMDNHYNDFTGKLIEKVRPVNATAGGGWTMIHIDSWESGSQNWSPLFRQEFIERRGYDPITYLPVYKGYTVGSPELSERFLWDLRQTAAELLIENHAVRFRELGRRSGFRLSIEPYDMNPAADLDLGSVADIPMCEFWSDVYGFNSAFSCIEATSIAHVTGAPVVAAEAFTAESNEAWRKYPGDMKNQGDWAFCIGINRFMYHTFAHKPYGDHLKPGMTMGPYGVHWDRGQTWWPMVGEYHKYITRCQFMLSQGKPVADILYLAAEGAPHVFRPPSTAMTGTSVMPDKRGYSFDGCSPLYLIKNASVRNGKIVFPGGASYNILVMPEVKAMTPELVEKISELVHNGATVVGNPPEMSPSLSGFPACDDKVREISSSIWGRNEIPEGLVSFSLGKGRLWWGKNIINARRGISNDPDSLSLYPEYRVTQRLLSEAGILKDFESSDRIRYTHRSFPDRDIYFLSNKTDSVINEICRFRDGTRFAEAWDPVTGEIRPFEVTVSGGITSMGIRLDRYQSLFIVFFRNKGQSVNTGRTVNYPELQIVSTLQGPWTVTFDTTMGGPAKAEFVTLEDWTSRPEEGIRYYSGIATYSGRFDLPSTVKKDNNGDLYLDLGTVRNIASVTINGRDLGVIWTSPWCVRITEAVVQKDNRLEIKVANLWINRLIGDENQPWDGIENGKWPEWILNNTQRPSDRYTFTTHRYYRKGDQPAESGLLGPVTIMFCNH
ncbi:MAG: glycosyl hydrolase [Bacteroidales bacterium]|nr:glycosyl hydrolase [Bacteroidales bacterium]